MISKTLLVAIGFSLTLSFRSFFRTLRKISLSPIAGMAAILAVSFVGAAVWRQAHVLLLQAYYSSMAGSLSVRLHAIPLGTFLYDGFVLLAWSLLYTGIHSWMELEEQRKRATKAEAMAQAARLQALQSQLEPHFLFNTLNAISTLVAEGQNAAAGRMIARLSDFLRLTLETKDTSEITLAEELEFVRRYLEIEQVRFGERLRVTIDAPNDALGGMVPVLLLQPLVENAVKHGVLAREQGGAISVTAERNNGCLRLCVADDGPGMAVHSVNGNGVGLRNTAARLSELYGNASQFSLGQSHKGGLAVTIEIPFRQTAQDRSEGGEPS